MEIASQLVNKGQRPERPYADDHCPACKARMGIAKIKKQTDRLRQRGAEEVRKDEISRQAMFRAFYLRFIRNEPIDYPDKLIPHQHLPPALDEFLSKRKTSVSGFNIQFK